MSGAGKSNLFGGPGKQKRHKEGRLKDRALMWNFLRAYIWMDIGLQRNLAERRWPTLSRIESQIMLLISVGITRPKEIASNLGVSRQGVYQAVSNLALKQLLDVDVDARDRRRKLLRFSPAGEAMRRDAIWILRQLEKELARRSGGKTMSLLKQMEDWDWGDEDCQRNCP